MSKMACEEIAWYVLARRFLPVQETHDMPRLEHEWYVMRDMLCDDMLRQGSVQDMLWHGISCHLLKNFNNY